MTKVSIERIVIADQQQNSAWSPKKNDWIEKKKKNARKFNKILRLFFWKLSPFQKKEWLVKTEWCKWMAINFGIFCNYKIHCEWQIVWMEESFKWCHFNLNPLNNVETNCQFPKTGKKISNIICQTIDDNLI